MKIPVHVVGGFLGVGKTTALTALVAARAGSERAAIVVNDFGEAGIDAARIEGEPSGLVQNIAGGCICCTAPEGLVRVVTELLEVQKPDRIYVEPSGLGRPRDVVDMLARGGLAQRVELRPIVVVVDPARLDLADPLMHEQWEGGDVLVVNRVDLATPGALDLVRRSVAEKWPPFQQVIETTFGVLPADLPDLARGAASGQHHPEAEAQHPDHDHDHDHVHGPGCAVPDSTSGFLARSAVLPGDRTYRWEALRRALDRPEIVRFKGMFLSDLGWVRVDVAGGVTDMRSTPWRRDSRYDLVVRAGEDALAANVVEQVAAAAVPQEQRGDGVALVDADGNRMDLDRRSFERLGALDVAPRVPGRVGTAVLLGDVLDLLAVRPDQRVVLSAADGLVADPVVRADLGDALLVYALDGADLPEKQGGPFRVLVPPGASRCANVKSLVRIRVL